MRMLTQRERWLIVRGHARNALRLRQPGHDVSDEPRDESGKWTEGGGDGGDHVETTHEAKPSGGYAPQTFHELKSSGAAAFHKAISEAKNASPHGAAVEVHSPDDYKSMRTFLTPDRKAGFALQGDNIVSLFKHPDSTAQGIAKSALTLATQLGGRRLDAFDTALPHLYSNAGFRAVARLPFDEKYAPPGWSKETFGKFNGGKPDVVFMVHDPEHAAPYKAGDGATVTSYDEGIKAQHDTLDQITKINSIVASVPGAKQAIATARAKLATGVSTKPASGDYSAARQEVHKRILGDIFTPERIAAATPAKGEQPTLHLMGGAGGSGKSYFVRAGHVPMDTAIYLNSDDVKAALPEYQGWNAALLHEESSDIAKLAESYAIKHGLNVILDGTMGSMSALDKRVADYKAAGYRIVGHFMRVTPETSTKRALERFVRGGETGRFVLPELLLKHNATANFEQARGKMDAWEMFDNEGPAPRLVAHS